MYEYRSELTQDVVSSGELRDKWERFRQLMGEVMAAEFDFDEYTPEQVSGDLVETDPDFDFDVFLGGYPGALDSILDYLDEAYGSIDASYTDFAALSGELDEWETKTAEDFRLNYMGKFPDVNLNQLEVIKELIGITAAYRELIARVRYDAAAILDSGIEACRNYEPSEGSSAWNTFFKTTGVLAGVAGAVALGLPTGGASVAGAATVVGALSGVGGAFTEEDGQDRRTYQEPAQILFDVYTALRDVSDQAATEAQAIEAALQQDISRVGDGGDLVVRRPDVADLEDGEYLTEFPYHGDMATISVNIYQLWRAGALRLPLVAVSYAGAAQQLNGTRYHRPWPLSSWPPAESAAASWDGLFDVVQRRLGETRDDLVDTGEILCGIAEAYARTDAEGADLVHDSASTLYADLLTQISESTTNGNLDDLPSSVPAAPGPDSDLAPAGGGYY